MALVININLYRSYVSLFYFQGDESWKEMVREAVKEDKELQKELVIQVASYGDSAEALQWAQFYIIDRSYWPYSVRMLHDNPDENRFAIYSRYIPLYLIENKNYFIMYFSYY